MLAETKSVELTIKEAKQLVTLLDEYCQTYSASTSVNKFHEELLDMLDELLGGQENDR